MCEQDTAPSTIREDAGITTRRSGTDYYQSPITNQDPTLVVVVCRPDTAWAGEGQSRREGRGVLARSCNLLQVDMPKARGWIATGPDKYRKHSPLPNWGPSQGGESNANWVAITPLVSPAWAQVAVVGLSFDGRFGASSSM